MFINLGNYYINTSDILYINTAGAPKPIATKTKIRQVDEGSWGAIEAILSVDPSFYKLSNFGYINLDNIISWDYSDINNSYVLRFLNSSMNIVLTPDKVEGLDDTFKNILTSYTPSTGGSGEGGVSRYAQLPDKPQINSVTLEGNKTLEDLNIEIPDSYTKAESDNLYIKVADKESVLSGTQDKIADSKAIKEYVDGQIGGIDLTGYIPKTDIETSLTGTAGKIPDSKAIKDAVDAAGGGEGTSNYTELTNKPQINSVELDGNKTSADLSLLGVDVIVQTLDGNETDKVPSVQTVKSYVDTKDGETLNSAKQYTDQKIAEIAGGGEIDLESYDEVKAYKASIKLNQDDLVIYQDKLYITKTAIPNTTTWETDSVNMVAVVNLDNYYDKGSVDTNFIPKTDIVDNLDGNETNKVASVQAIKTAIDNISIDLSTDIEADKAVENKAPTTKAVYDYTYSKLGTEAKIDEKIAEIVIPDDVKLYEASIELDKDTLVIYNDELYIVKTAVDNTTEWGVDNVNLVKVNKDIASIDYGIVENKPQINGVDLVGNKTSTDLSLLSASDIVQTLDGDETNKVPSVITVKTAIENSQKELSNDIETDKDNQEKVTTPKAVYDFVQANTLTTENDGVYDITKIGKYYELVKKIRLQDGIINTQELKEITVLNDTSINIVHASACIDSHNLLFSTVITSNSVKLIAVNMGETPIDYRSLDVSLRILSTIKPDGGYTPIKPELKDPKLGNNDEYGEDPYNPEDTKDNKAISTKKETIVLENSLDIPVVLNGATYEAESDNEHITVGKEDSNLKLNSISQGESIITVTFKKDGFIDKVRKLYIVASKTDPDLQVSPSDLSIIATQTGTINITGTAAWTAVSKGTEYATIDKPSGTGADTITVNTLKKGATKVEIDVAETEDTAAKKFIVNITINGKDSDLTATPESITVELGGTAKITVSGTQSFTTESESDGIATIDGEGNVTPVSEGRTNLYIKGTADDIWNEKTITIPCTVTKKNPDTNLNKTDIEIATTETGIVSVTHTVPEGGWTARIENEEIATVNTAEGTGNADLTITGVKAGTTKLIVESKDDPSYNKVTKECNVVIKDRVQLVFPEGDIVTSPGEAVEVSFQSDAELGSISATLEDPSFGTVEVVAGE